MLEVILFLLLFYVGCIVVAWVTYQIIIRLPGL